MSRKSMMLALAATVSLGVVALSTSSASAFHPVGGAGAVHYTGAAKFSAGLHVYKPLVTGIKFTPKVTGIIIKPPHWHWHSHWHWNYGWWRRPMWIAPAVATGGMATYASAPSAPATSTCTCLTKQYTPQGAVVFKDVCTNEMAMNPPANASPAADAGPQMPQQPYQQGYLQPQAQ